MFVVTVVLSALLALAFAGAGSAKAAGQPKTVEGAAHVGYSAAAFRRIGLAELAGSAGLLVGLWLAPLGVAAGIGLVLLMAGAVLSHVRVKDSLAQIAPPTVLGLLALAAVVVRIASA